MSELTELTRYMRSLGRKGGRARSTQKTQAVRRNLAKARETLQLYRLRPELRPDRNGLATNASIGKSRNGNNGHK